MKYTLILDEAIEQNIYIISGHKIMLGTHLADLYGVTAKVLMQAVRRNIERFLCDFMFKLTWKEAKILRSQFATLKRREKLLWCTHAFHKRL